MAPKAFLLLLGLFIKTHSVCGGNDYFCMYTYE